MTLSVPLAFRGNGPKTNKNIYSEPELCGGKCFVEGSELVADNRTATVTGFQSQSSSVNVQLIQTYTVYQVLCASEWLVSNMVVLEDLQDWSWEHFCMGLVVSQC